MIDLEVMDVLSIGILTIGIVCWIMDIRRKHD